MHPIPDISTIISAIEDIARTAKTHNQCYGWGSKQDLYILKWLIEDKLKKIPKFEDEDDWLKFKEQQRIINILKNDTT